MKKIILLQISLLIGCSIQAQRFFYVATGNMAERPVKESLLKASQFVTPTQVMSDYTIDTEINFKKETHTASLKIVLKDSASFRTIYQTNEEYDFPLPQEVPTYKPVDIIITKQDSIDSKGLKKNCIVCAASIPKQAKFCNKCGNSQ